MHILEYEYCFYQNQKGWLLQNVLAACNFDIQFWFILPGWKGLSDNSRILKEAIDKKEFVMPKEKYWLADAGYSNFNHLFTSYKYIRYYLKK